MTYPKVILRANRLASIKRRHPWIFSGGIKSYDDCHDGDIVEVLSTHGEFLAIGYFQDASIMVRILSFEKMEIDDAYWDEQFNKAISLRRTIGIPNKNTNGYRLIHGEGDGVPGLVVDIYNNIAVIQCHAIGIHMMSDQIAKALKKCLGDHIDSIYLKGGNTLPSAYASGTEDRFIQGKGEITSILENGCAFNIDIINGQKTGFFLDQRENRNLLNRFSKDKKVLNLFSYSGGFSIYALEGGATEVCSVDASSRAIELCEQNVLMSGHSEKHSSVVSDVSKYFQDLEQSYYDIIIVDPPAFAKSVRKKHNAVQAYKRINAQAIKNVKSGGIVFTFSCSQVIDQLLFYNTITAAAIEARRHCQVLHHLSQGPDHPVSLFHPEGRYLKGLVLRVL